MLWTPPLRSPLVGMTGALARGFLPDPSHSYSTLVAGKVSSVAVGLSLFRSKTSCIRKSSLGREGQKKLESFVTHKSVSNVGLGEFCST